MKYFFWLFLILLIVCRFLVTRPVYQNGDRVRVKSKVTAEPVQYSDSQYLKLSGLKVYLPPYPSISYGDRVIVEGVVDGDKLKEVKLVGFERNNNFLLTARERIINFFQKTFPEPHASLLAGVVLGAKGSLPQTFWENLRRTGTAHVVVASGMNVTLVAGFLMNTFVTFLSRKKAIAFALVAIWVYALMVGFEAPIVRAAIMGSLAFSAQMFGRLYSAWRALLISAGIMLVVQPGWLTDLGFILSFVATASLMLFQFKVDRLISFVPRFLRQDLSTTIAAQIGVAPIIWATFGQFNLLSPLINAAVLWTIPLITVIGMIAGMISLVVPQIASLILYLTYPLTAWFVWVINSF